MPFCNHLGDKQHFWDPGQRNNWTNLSCKVQRDFPAQLRMTMHIPENNPIIQKKVVKAVSALHSCNIIHNDLHFGSMLIRKDKPRIRLIDLHLAYESLSVAPKKAEMSILKNLFGWYKSVKRPRFSSGVLLFESFHAYDSHVSRKSGIITAALILINLSAFLLSNVFKQFPSVTCHGTFTTNASVVHTNNGENHVWQNLLHRLLNGSCYCFESMSWVSVRDLCCIESLQVYSTGISCSSSCSFSCFSDTWTNFNSKLSFMSSSLQEQGLELIHGTLFQSIAFP